MVANTGQVAKASSNLQSQSGSQSKSSNMQVDGAAQTTAFSNLDSPDRSNPSLLPGRMLVDRQAKGLPLEDDMGLPNYDEYARERPNVLDSRTSVTRESARARFFQRSPSFSPQGQTPLTLSSGSVSPDATAYQRGFKPEDHQGRLNRPGLGFVRQPAFQFGSSSSGPGTTEAGPSDRHAEPTAPPQFKVGEQSEEFVKLELPSDPMPSTPSDQSVSGNGFHPFAFKLQSNDATDKDFEQDRGRNTFSLDDIPANFPLFISRYKRESLPNKNPRTTVQVNSEVSTPGSREWTGSNNETPVKAHSGPGGRDVTAVEDEDAIMRTAITRFDPRFVDLVPPEDIKFSKSLQDTAEWLRARPSELRAFLSMHPKRYLPDDPKALAGLELAKKSPQEDTISDACAKLLQAISVKFLSCLGVDTAKSPSWVACGTHTLLPAKSKPSRKFGSEPATKPDQVMILPSTQESIADPVANATHRGTKRKRADPKAKPVRLTYENVLVLTELKKDPKVESKVNGKDSHDRMVPRVLRYALNTAANNAIAGRVTVSAVAATLIRFWFADPFSFATTRVWDFARPEHAEEIVKMVAFLLGPIQNVLQTWKPPLERFSTRIPVRRYDGPDSLENVKLSLTDDEVAVTSETALAGDSLHMDVDTKGDCNQSIRQEGRDTIMHWEWVNKEYKEVWWQDKLLFSRRTTIWEGKTRQVDSRETAARDDAAAGGDLPLAGHATLDCYVKATYLPPGLANHEHDMIVCLDPEIPLPDNSEFAKLDDEIKNQVYQNLPRSLGLVDFGTSGSPTTNPLPDNSPTDGRAPNLTYLELVALVIQGPMGNTLDPLSQGLTLADVCEIYQGPFLQLWYGAEKGVHFRDVSEGNILWKTLPDGRMAGFLIDYGNARFESERRDKSLSADTGKGVCEDDLRSGTQQFLCVAVLDASRVMENCRVKELAMAGQTDQDRDPDDIEQLAAYRLELLVNRHRYIDDLETWLYNLLWHVSQATNVIQTALRAIRKFLTDPDKKRAQWGSDLIEMANAIENQRFKEMIMAIAKIIRRTRREIKDIMSSPDLPKRLTPQEVLVYPEVWKLFTTGCRELRAQEQAAVSAQASPA